MDALLTWLLDSPEPWTRYRTQLDLFDLSEDAPEVNTTRAAMLAHPQVQALIAAAAGWPGDALKRHNDAGHPLYALSTLADFGLNAADPGMAPAVDAVLAHQAAEGAFQTVLNIGVAYGGTGEDTWTWVLCDAPTLLYTLLVMGLGADGRVQRAVEHLVGTVDDNGWRCRCAPVLGKFRGPGRKGDPCPIANVLALKALALAPPYCDCLAARRGVEMLLGHWERRAEVKYYLFGAGTDFRKLKYPFIWYDILHVVDVLSSYPFAHADPRFQDMVAAIATQADVQGCYTAGSMYQAWKGWSFADKKQPSPWLTFLVMRIQRRMQGGLI
ncbi:MAG TPA: hypothetical protein VL334_11510 [Anaerolineae bacterium]|nr:hypothetical protein [Anaerolineae bacterium]